MNFIRVKPNNGCHFLKNFIYMMFPHFSGDYSLFLMKKCLEFMKEHIWP